MNIQMTDVQVSKLNRRNRKRPIAKFKLNKFESEVVTKKEVTNEC